MCNDLFTLENKLFITRYLKIFVSPKIKQSTRNDTLYFSKGVIIILFTSIDDKCNRSVEVFTMAGVWSTTEMSIQLSSFELMTLIKQVKMCRSVNIFYDFVVD